MQPTKLLAATAVLGLAVVCLAGEKWDAKDPATWSHDDVYKLMHDSPWARPAKFAMQGERGGGMGYPGGRGGQNPNDPNDPNAGNYPGGGGYPGGSRRGGVYLPGGMGLPFPGGGGYPGGRGGGGRGGNRRESAMTGSAVVRWDSALPLRLAYAQQDPDARQAAGTAKPDKAAATPGGWRKTDSNATPASGEQNASSQAKEAEESRAPAPVATGGAPAEYVIAVDGFPLNTGGGRYSHQRRSDTQRTGGAENEDTKDNSAYGGRDPEAIREELMERTTLTHGSGRVLRPVKVEFDLPGKTGIIYFHFSREEEITPKDKEIDFQTQLGGNRLERKFETKEMVYKGRLEL
jgi:hypothetical protein